MTHFIDLINISKTFERKTVLDCINLYIDKNEFVTLLGPSGCGKTTTLRIIGGFESPTAGELHFNGKNINSVPPNKRKVNTVFQKYALFPHMNVLDNIAFGLILKKVDKKTIADKVARMLKLVNLENFQKRTIDSLSGGQQQRVAIARALINEPEVLLLDEPLAALDLKLRLEMQMELKNMQQKLGITFVYVTHDQGEALSMSDTIVVMDSGKILQIGSPEDVYNKPKSAFVAKFIGESNLLDGIMRSDFHVEFSGVGFLCTTSGLIPGEPVDVVVRPEDVEIDTEISDESPLRGRVSHIIFKGMYYEILVDVSGFTWKVHSTVQSPVGAEVGLKITPDSIHVMRRR